MPSTIAPSSVLEERSSADPFLNPWNWVAVIFAVQTLGALIVTHQFQLSFTKMALPIGFLVLGFAIAVGFRWYDSASRVGLWKWWLPVAIYALVVFLLSHRSYPEARATVDTKLFHPLEYLTLGILLSGAWRCLQKQIGTPGFLFCVQLSGTAYALSDEFHQGFIPGRTPSLTDVLIDSVGVALGLGVFLLGRLIVQNVERGRLALKPSSHTLETSSSSPLPPP